MNIDPMIPIHDPLMTRPEWAVVITGFAILILIAVGILLMFMTGMAVPGS